MYTLAREHPLFRQIYDSAAELFDRAVARSTRDGKTWHLRLNKEEAVAQARKVLDGSAIGVYAFILCDTHLLFVSVGRMWWETQPWLIEQWYLRIAPGRSDPLAAVDMLATDLGCSAVAFGTSLAANDAALGRMLTSKGYRLESTQYIKDYTWQHSPQSPLSG
jgi:hypothetical protein